MAERTPRGVLVSVDDLDAALQIYQGILGMSVDFRDGAHFAQLSKDGFRISLATADDHPAPGSTALMVKSDHVAEAVGQLAAAGGEVLVVPTEGRDEVRGVVRMPGGAVLVVYGAA